MTGTVAAVARALGAGIPNALGKIEGVVRDDRDLHNAAELAHKLAGFLPDRIPAANFGQAVDMAPKDIQAAQPQSLSDALAKLLGKDVAAAVSGLPKPIRDAIIKAIPDAITTGITAALKQAMSQSPLPGQIQNAITSSVEAAFKQKDSGPPMDRKQDTSGPDAPPPPPPPRTPPQASPTPPAVPGETIPKTPPINIPDTPPAQKPDGGT